MLVEQTFVTTREAEDVFKAARQLLLAGGFQDDSDSPTHIQVKRGRKDPARAKLITDLPQHVRIEFDRGRVFVAASIAERSKAGPLHRNLLLGIVRGLEMAILSHAEPAQAQTEWFLAEQRIVDDAARRRRRWRIVMTLTLGIAFALIVLIVWAAAS